jgi:phospholipase/carboxylesterase
MRVRPANTSPPARIYLLIHGWTGDERSMEIFSRGLPADSLILFPRGPVQAPGGGYGWADLSAEATAQMDDLAQPAHALLQEVDRRVSEITGASLSSSLPGLYIAGFSQGAAVAYTLTLLYPRRITRLAALAGFLPVISPHRQIPDLSGLPVYIAHGRKDETIPIERARDAARLLQAAGAEVNFCENEAGHKLPANCFSELTRFLTA